MNNILIYQGNRLEDLADELGSLMHEKRRSSFSFEPDTILVNNYEMSQWLSVRIAEQQGICANVRFRLFGSFAWSLAAGMVEDTTGQDVITADHLKWMVFRCLQEISHHGDDTTTFSELSEYIGKHSAGGTYHLSRQLADLFDRYLNYRFSMIEAWSSGEKEKSHGWQPAFWNLLSEAAGDRFRVHRLRQLIEAIRDGEGRAQKTGFPSRIYLFGVSYLPPLHLDILSALSSVSEIHMFIMSPCRKYWMDTVSEKSRARLGRIFDQETVNSLFPTGNRLLSALGYAGRSFLASLYSFEPGEGKDFFRSNSRDSDQATLLSMIQDDILELRESREETGQPRRAIRSTDRSLGLHSCHSPLREVEVLHDQIVEMLNEDTTLKPHHILVMAPSMEKYAPFVQAVFGSAPNYRKIPFSIADLGLVHDNPVVRAFLTLFSLPSTDFTATDVMDVLEQPVIAERAGLDSEAMALIRQWIRESGIRRGIESLSPSTEVKQNSWVFGLDRLFATAAMNSLGHSEDLDILPLPFPVEGGDYKVLATLSGFFFSVAALAQRLGEGKELSPESWRSLFMELIEEFISEGPETDPLAAPLLEHLNAMTQEMKAAGVKEMDYGTMLSILKEELGKSTPPRSFISGNVLFSSLVPMRSIPFRIICLLGMNDADFPRRPGRPAFDLMAGDWRPGDRIPREEDRYLFLETLMSARERLLISYTGRRDTDNAIMNPSLVVSELMDYVRDEFFIENHDGENVSPSEFMFVEHPLQPFSMRYLRGERGIATFAKEWLPIDEQGKLLEKHPPSPLCNEQIPLEDDEKERFYTVSPSQFAAMLGNPARFFLRNRLSIDVYEGEQILEDSEPFFIGRREGEMVLAHLSRMDQAGLETIASDMKPFLREMRELARHSGLLPVGIIGDIQWENDIERVFSSFISKISEHGALCGTASADCLLNPGAEAALHITGPLGTTGRERGLLEYRMKVYSSEKISLWVRHLLLSLEQKAPFQSVIVCPKTNVVLREAGPADARDILNTLCKFYRMGLEKPLSFFPGPSWEFAKYMKPARKRGKETTDEEREREAVRKARNALCSWNQTGVIRDRWTDYLCRGNHALAARNIESCEFRETTMEILSPLLDYLKSGR